MQENTNTERGYESCHYTEMKLKEDRKNTGGGSFTFYIYKTF